MVPDENIIAAYSGAIARYPDAAGYIGLTNLPPAATLIQQALLACNICFFYSIATKMKSPPWGVTANICVKARTNNAVWFNKHFPRIGGGEDVDFCMNLRKRTGQRLVPVPGAKVTHPFWTKPLRQVAGWASGDVLCLDTLPSCSFYALPNWALIALVFLAIACVAEVSKIWWSATAAAVEVLLSCATYWH